MFILHLDYIYILIYITAIWFSNIFFQIPISDNVRPSLYSKSRSSMGWPNHWHNREKIFARCLCHSINVEKSLCIILGEEFLHNSTGSISYNDIVSKFLPNCMDLLENVESVKQMENTYVKHHFKPLEDYDPYINAYVIEMSSSLIGGLFSLESLSSNNVTTCVYYSLKIVISSKYKSILEHPLQFIIPSSLTKMHKKFQMFVVQWYSYKFICFLFQYFLMFTPIAQWIHRVLRSFYNLPKIPDKSLSSMKICHISVYSKVISS